MRFERHALFCHSISTPGSYCRIRCTVSGPCRPAMRISPRWKSIKILFSRSLPKTELIPTQRQRRGERGIWQRRYWEHTIVDDRDYEAHINYVHLNPVKHGLVGRAIEWPYSTFHRFVAAGIYPVDWMGNADDFEGGE